MIKKSFILSCISAVALSLDDMEMSTLAQIKANARLNAYADVDVDDFDSDDEDINLAQCTIEQTDEEVKLSCKERKAAILEARIAELMAEDEDMTAEEAEAIA